MKILILIFFFEIKESKITNNLIFNNGRNGSCLTRGHNYTLVKKQSRLDVRKYSFSQRTINVWNNLSTDCEHASSVKGALYIIQILCRRYTFWSYPAGLTIADPPG